MAKKKASKELTEIVRLAKKQYDQIPGKKVVVEKKPKGAWQKCIKAASKVVMAKKKK